MGGRAAVAGLRARNGVLLRVSVRRGARRRRREQAGSASGTLNAVQQIANAVGAALI